MVKQLGFLFILPILLASCSEEPAIDPVRESIGTMYVTSDEAPVLERPDPSSPAVTTFKSGEAATILALKDQWAEVRLDIDRSGWMAREHLAEASEAGQTRSTPSEIKFRRPPSPVFRAGSVRGQILLEASVDANGNVTSVRTISNTTGSPELEQMNRGELLRAKFYPLVSAGRKTPFVYSHRVEY